MFKVGDKVEVISCGLEQIQKIGYRGIITRIGYTDEWGTNDAIWLDRMDKGGQWFGVHNLKLLKEEVMSATLIEVTETYQLVTESENAHIVFKDKKFERCDFNFTNPYTYAQWMFLRVVANEIERIRTEKSGEAAK